MTKAHKRGSASELLTPKYLDFLHACFDISKIDRGILIWKVRPRHHFHRDQDRKLFNSVYAGRVVGNQPSVGRPHVTVVITHGELGTTRVYLHRLIWLLYWGETPPRMIDHKNRLPFDNRPSNLRATTKTENTNNSIASKTCLSSGEVIRLEDGKFRMSFRHPGATEWNLKFDSKVEALASLNYLSFLHETADV